jgi:hypothetical protein
MAAHKVEEESYWPGYVDAIINVVLNILFMVAVFTVALSTVDFTPPKPVQAAVAPAIAQTAALTLPSFRVALSPTITRPFCAVPRTSVARTASD